MMTLRSYQQHAIDTILADVHHTGNSIVSIACGGGKSHVIAEVAKVLTEPILILVPSKELLEQNLEKIARYFPKENIGIYSASMGEKNVKHITIGTILSVCQKPELFQRFRLVLLDECHLLNPKEIETTYTAFFRAINNPKVVGLSATPFRLTQSYSRESEMVTSIKVINRIKGKNPTMFWGKILINVTTEYLIAQGFLHRPQYFDNTKVQHEYIPVNKSKSDFNLEAYEEMILPIEEGIMDGISRLSSMSHTVLVFCVSVEQAERFAKVVKDSAVVSAATSKKERERIILQFKEGDIKVVFNVACLTTGFDHPRLDGIVLIRPTRSLGLYSQMIGRIMRIHPDKKIARVIDYSGTIKSLGHAESIEIYQWGRVWDIGSSREKHWHGRELYRFKVKEKEV